MLAELRWSVTGNWIRRYTIYNCVPFIFNGLLLLWSEIAASVHAWESAALELLYAAFYIWYRRWAYRQLKTELEEHSIGYGKPSDFKSIVAFIKQLRARVKTSRICYWDLLFFLVHLFFGLTLIAFMLRTS